MELLVLIILCFAFGWGIFHVVTKILLIMLVFMFICMIIGKMGGE